MWLISCASTPASSLQGEAAQQALGDADHGLARGVPVAKALSVMLGMT